MTLSLHPSSQSPSASGCLRIYETPVNFQPDTNWVHMYISWPRKYAEWVKLIQNLRTPIFSEPQVEFPQLNLKKPYIPNTIPDIWCHRNVAADQLEACLFRNQWIRWQMMRIRMAIRRRIMNRRLIGKKDVGTLEITPAPYHVRVYDWPTRSLYQFHVDTIHQQIVVALKYQHLAISRPMEPKNPYTNLPWHYGQLLSIFDQMHRVLWRMGRRFLDPSAQVFQRENLSLQAFHNVYGDVLNVECARDFFMNSTSEYWEALYGDVLSDIFNLIQTSTNTMKNISAALLKRTLPKHLLQEWDELVLGFWCFENLNQIVLNNVCSFYDILEKATNLIKSSQRAAAIATTTNTPPTRTAAIATTTARR